MLLAVTTIAMAQKQRISGTVTDPDGPVMMANVVEKDANNRIVSATQTDFNGNFSMEISNPKNKLVVSFVGDKTETLSIGSKTTFNVVLKPDKTTLQEVTVRGSRRNSGGLSLNKKEIATSQQTFNMDDVEGLAFTSADEALQGEIAGLDIVSNSGNLGAGTTMRLRGVTTINGDANPLIVVDDKIFDNPDEDFDFANASEEEYAALLSVNTEDIAKIDVLKDAAATAVWGSQGSNGVILITTKRGSRGKPKIGFSYKITGTWQPKGYDLLNGDEYTMLMKEEFYNPSQSSDATSNVYELNYNKDWAEYENWNNNTDWVKAVKQFGLLHNWNLSLTGGGQKAQFRISASYDKQSGSIIKQSLDRFTTRLVLDYNVSDRIRVSVNFPLTYTNNLKNYKSLLSIAQQMAPNMAIYRQDANGNDTDDYYIMNPLGNSSGTNSPATGNYSSYKLSDIRELGNPVAIANLAWKKEQTYRMNPDFNIKYELLGTEHGKHRLTFNGRVDFDIYANSSPTYWPAALETNVWTDANYNIATSTESNRFKMNARGELIFTPAFKNEDFFSQTLVRYEMSKQKYNTQYIATNTLPTGITSTTADAYTTSMSSSNSESASQYALINTAFAYKDRYVLNASLRMDGNSKFGPKNKWAYFPGVSLRYNISDEPFMKSIREKAKLSLLSLRLSWGIVGNAPSSDYLFYNTYTTAAGYYGGSSNRQQVTTLDGLKLDDLRWEKTESYNIGANLGFFNDKLEFTFDYYHKMTRDLLQKYVTIPSTTGYSSVAYANVGTMMNRGWELYINARDIVKAGKFSFSASFNIAQNYNELKEMDDRVLNSINSDWVATTRGVYLNRIQVGNPLGSIYGFRYKGTYQYSYEYLENLRKENGWSSADYESYINNALAEGKTFPVVVDENGKVVMTSAGLPQRMVYNYSNSSNSYTYAFNGGDAMYEDVNHDGNINALDVVYLGNSMPKASGGFNFTFKYGRWSLKTRFMYRFGNKVVNAARMALEKMYGTYNQTTSVNWRWRKDGDITPMPRAAYNYGYNWQGSDRYVEDGSFVRFQNLQLSYTFDKKLIKKWGLNRLQLYFSMNNLYCWTRYSGVDPEVTIGSWGVATDSSQTPRSKSFTASVNVEF